MAKSAPENLIGRTIAGKFLVEGAIGSGAMGAVYRARQIALDKIVAIKVLHDEHAGDPSFAARFQREAKAASRLNHPNSIQVLDFGADPDGFLYIAMEYVDGRSLHRVLREQGALPAPRVADILMQTLAALAVAHDMGVVHRDLKPENIVILSGADDDGRPKDIVKVCDFGIAKITDSRAYRGTPERESTGPVTTAGFLVGTPEYMSPEQAKGEPLDARSDLYSVGVVLYEMLTGRVPFEAESAIGVVLRHITEEPVRPSRLVPSVDGRLEAICMTALRKPRDARYQNARAMRAELRPLVDAAGVPLAASSAPNLGDLREPVPRDPHGLGDLREPVPCDPRDLPHPSVGDLAAATASTVRMDSGPVRMAAAAAAYAYEHPQKPTLAGTSATVGREPRRLAKVALAALATGGMLAVVVSLAIARSHRMTRGVSPAKGGPAVVAIAPATILEVATDDTVPPLDVAAGPGSLPPSTVPHGPRALAVPVSAKPGATATAPAAVVGSSSTPTPSTPSATPTVATPPPSVPPVDPSFDAARAYVEIGLINAQGVREPAVRGALHGARFANCYRTALKAQGARVTGVGTLNLSIDDQGVARAAIVTGAGFLPGLARCVQGAAAGVTVAKSQVDSGGGTAEVTIAFKAP